MSSLSNSLNSKAWYHLKGNSHSHKVEQWTIYLKGPSWDGLYTYGVLQHSCFVIYFYFLYFFTFPYRYALCIINWTNFKLNEFLHLYAPICRPSRSKFRNFPAPRNLPMPFPSQYPHPFLLPLLFWLLLTLVRFACPWTQYKWNLTYFLICAWLLLCSITSAKAFTSLQGVYSFLNLSVMLHFMNVPQLIIHSIDDRHLSCFQCLDVMNKTTVVDAYSFPWSISLGLN